MKSFIAVFSIILLAILQIAVAPHFAVFGVRPNLALAGFLAIFSSGSFFFGIVLSILAGVVYDLSGFYFGFNCLVFVASFLVFWFFGKRYLLAHRSFSLFVFGILGTLVFNILYVGFSYLFYHYNLFGYFLSWGNLLEALLNGVVVLIVDFLLRRLFNFKNHETSS